MVPDGVLTIEIVAAVTGPGGIGCAARAGADGGPLEELAPAHPNSSEPAATAPRVLRKSRRDSSRPWHNCSDRALSGASFAFTGVHASGCTEKSRP